MTDFLAQTGLSNVGLHELAHIRRGDHLFRGLEWLACVGFWWNPLVWWAQRNLRAAKVLIVAAESGRRLAPNAEPRQTETFSCRQQKEMLVAIRQLALTSSRISCLPDFPPTGNGK